MMHGCGVKISRQPNGNFLAEEGQFVNDEWAGDVMACTVDQARAAAAESDIAAQMARVFQLPESKASASSRVRSVQAASVSVFRDGDASGPKQSNTETLESNNSKFKPIKFITGLLRLQK